MNLHVLFFSVFVAFFTITYVSAKPFYWTDNSYRTTKKPLLKVAFSKVNHWFKELIDAYPSSTWSWREHFYGRTYWDDPVVKKAWYYKGIEDDHKKRHPEKRVIWNQYDAERYHITTKPGCQGDDWSLLDKSISDFRVNLA